MDDIKQTEEELILELINNISSKNYKNKFFSHRPISGSREEAMIDSDVDKFLMQKYDIDIMKKEDEYVSSFFYRLLSRSLNLEELWNKF